MITAEKTGENNWDGRNKSERIKDSKEIDKKNEAILKVENLLKTIPKTAFDTEKKTREGITKKNKAMSRVNHLIASIPEVSCHVPF